MNELEKKNPHHTRCMGRMKTKHTQTHLLDSVPIVDLVVG